MEGPGKQWSGREIWRVREKAPFSSSEAAPQVDNWSTHGFPSAEVRLGRKAREQVYGKPLFLYIYYSVLFAAKPHSWVWATAVQEDRGMEWKGEQARAHWTPFCVSITVTGLKDLQGEIAAASHLFASFVNVTWRHIRKRLLGNAALA